MLSCVNMYYAMLRLQGSLRTPCDHRLCFTSLQTAGDPNLIRACEGHSPRLSTASWSASPSPAQDWIAHVTTPSLPGNKRTPWLVVNITLCDVSPVMALAPYEPRLEPECDSHHVLSSLLDEPLLPFALPGVMPTASRATLRLPSDLGKSGSLTITAHHYEPIAVQSGKCRAIGDVQHFGDISRPSPLTPERPHLQMLIQPVAIHISTSHFGCLLINPDHPPEAHLRAHPDVIPAPPLHQHLPLIPHSAPHATPHSGLALVSSPSPSPLLPRSTPASTLQLPSPAVPRPICFSHSLSTSALPDGLLSSPSRPSQWSSTLSSSHSSLRAPAQLFSQDPCAVLRPVSPLPPAPADASSLLPAKVSSPHQTKERPASGATAARPKSDAATEVPVASRRSHQARRSKLPATEPQAAAQGPPPGLPRPPPGLLPPIIQVTGTYLERHRPTMTRLRRRYDTLLADHVFFKCDSESDDERAPAVQKPDPFMAKEWLHDLCPGRDQEHR